MGRSLAPAILYIHAHGDHYDIGAREVLDGRPALQGPLGQTRWLAWGFAVLCIDLPGFRGARRQNRKAIWPRPRFGRVSHWQARWSENFRPRLNGCMHKKASTRPRIGVFGISMGATLGYWLAAVEPRLAAVAHLCCFADFSELIRTGAHDLHGIYLTVPGLLTLTSIGKIAGQIAPRRQFVGIGDQDPLTPALAVDLALIELRTAYVGLPQKPELSAEVRRPGIKKPPACAGRFWSFSRPFNRRHESAA